MRPMMSGSRRIVPVSRSIETISASSMPSRAADLHVVQRDAQPRKNIDLRLAASETSRPVQAAICSPMRVFSVSRGNEHDEQREERGGEERSRRRNPERRASFRLVIPRARPR